MDRVSRPPKQSNQYSGSDGIGLTIMKFRANTIGGVLNIERNDTGGTTVRVSLPVGLLDNEKGTLPDEKRARRRSPPRFPHENESEHTSAPWQF
ncbi:MAG: hypothetical protein R3C56_03685 [Pirellulaceae bacterium]